VRIDVYEDPQCPACGQFTTRIEPLLIAGPVTDGEVFLTYKDMTFLGPESFEAAAAMRVAEELDGKFWEYHHVLFHNQEGENEGAFSTSRLADMAELIGLERDEFLLELEDPRYIEAVQAEFDEARELGINSVPTLVVNGQLLRGVPGWDELRELIDMLATNNLASTLQSQGDFAGARDLF
jgi:protein-disulfide isomerase